MSTDCPVDTGGAVFNAGPLQIKDTVFAENTAKERGVAIYNLESAVELWNVTFEGNILSCPSQMFSDTEDVSPAISLATHNLTILEHATLDGRAHPSFDGVEFGSHCREFAICILFFVRMFSWRKTFALLSERPNPSTVSTRGNPLFSIAFRVPCSVSGIKSTARK